MSIRLSGKVSGPGPIGPPGVKKGKQQPVPYPVLPIVPQRRVRAAVQGEEEDGLEEELHRGFSCDVGAVTVVTSQRRRGGQKVCTRSLHLTSVSRFESDQRLADRYCRAKSGV